MSSDPFHPRHTGIWTSESDSQARSLVLSPQTPFGVQAPGLSAQTLGHSSEWEMASLLPTWQGKALVSPLDKAGPKRTKKSLRTHILSAKEENAGGSDTSPSWDRTFDPCLPAVESEGPLCDDGLLTVTSVGSWVLPTPTSHLWSLCSGHKCKDTAAPGRSRAPSTEGDMSLVDERGLGSFAATGASGMGFGTSQIGSKLLPHGKQSFSWAQGQMGMKLRQPSLSARLC